jgi:hypothetical protein
MAEHFVGAFAHFGLQRVWMLFAFTNDEKIFMPCLV